MKTIISLLVILFCITNHSFAAHVELTDAKKVALNFIKQNSKTIQLISDSDLILAHSENHTILKSELTYSKSAYYYVFNIGNTGFIIIAGDDASIPVLAYSNEGVFTPASLPTSTKKWLEVYKSQLREIIENQLSPTQQTEQEWNDLLKSKVETNVEKASVAPLMLTKWNQAPNENGMCPGGSVTGCVATAMAQIMKYWNYPATGSGFHSYNHTSYGTLAANFGSTSYNWGAMPNVLNSPNSAVATLMYHAGVSVNMDYSPQSSGAFVISAQSPVQNCSEYALKTYFGYKPTLQGRQRSTYTDANWIALLKAELDANRPILYAGFGSGGGHAFVADGYDNSNFFHFNWGWGGNSDGYFQINALNPGALGTGGGSGGYNSGQQAVIGIEPPVLNPQPSNLALYNYVMPSASSIYYNQSFSVSTNIINNGTGAFAGDYCAAVFDNQSNFVDYVQISTGNSLPSGFVYNNNLVFSSGGLLSMLPGTYFIKIFSKVTGGNWVEVASNGSYTNSAQIQVINPNDIELYSAMVVTPSGNLVQGQAASVNLNIINNGFSTFYGVYNVSLYNLDGSFAQTIADISESNGLPNNFVYNPPYLTFSTNTITVAPGTYYLATSHNPNNTGWQLTGSSYHQNPIKVKVVAPAPQPDIYEVNNAVAQAYNLPVTFSGNNVVRTTPGSNIHISSDNDFYKIVLPSGFSYNINPRLHDSYNSGNGNVYTVDALVSYSINGINWSEPFDDLVSPSIQLNNGGTVYFHVAPYFAGEMGTYLLDAAITRSAVVAIQENELSELVSVYPNPANDWVTIECDNFEAIQSIEMYSIGGAKMAINNLQMIDSTKVTISVSHLTDGIYFLQLSSSETSITKKIVVKR